MTSTSFLIYDGKTLSVVAFDGTTTFAMPAETLADAERAVLALAHGLFREIEQGGPAPSTGPYAPACVKLRTADQPHIEQLLCVIGAEARRDPEREVDHRDSVGLRRQLHDIGRWLGLGA